MKAIVLHEYGPATSLKYEDMPDPSAAPGEVLIRVRAAGINPIDWKIRSGAMAKFYATDFPYIPGYDFAGTVQALGAGVTGFAPGDIVFGRTASCYAELTTIQAANLAKVPTGLDLNIAGVLATSSTTADQLIHEALKVASGQTILLTGALGAVGRFALFAALESGAKVIAGVRTAQIAEALALGATTAIDTGDDAALAALGTVDAVADVVGGPLADKLLSHVKPGGSFGSTIGPPQDAPLHPAIRVIAISSHDDAKAMLHFAEALRDGKLTLPIDRTYPLAQAAEAQAYAEHGAHGKVLLTL